MAVAVTSLLAVSCVLSDRAQWSIHKPKDDLDVWHAPITISMSHVSPETALRIVESNVLFQTGNQIRLSYGELPEPFNDEAPSLGTISFAASNIAPCDVVRIIADTQSCGALFRGKTSVLAPSLHGDGHVSIELTGRCVDAITGERVPYIDLVGKCQRVITDKTGGYRVRLEVEGYYENYHVDAKTCFRESHPEEKEVTLMASAPNYASQMFAIQLHSSYLVYTNDIRMISIVVQHGDTPNPHSPSAQGAGGR